MSVAWNAAGYESAIRPFRDENITFESGSPASSLVGMRWAGSGNVESVPSGAVQLQYVREFALGLTLSGDAGAEVLSGSLGLGQYRFAGFPLSTPRDAELTTVEETWSAANYPHERDDPLQSIAAVKTEIEGEASTYIGIFRIILKLNFSLVYYPDDDVWHSPDAIRLFGDVSRLYDSSYYDPDDPPDDIQSGVDILVPIIQDGPTYTSFPLFGGNYHYTSYGGGALSGTVTVGQWLDRW